MRELTELTEKKKKEMLFPLRPFEETREKKGKKVLLSFPADTHIQKKKKYSVEQRESHKQAFKRC